MPASTPDSQLCLLGSFSTFHPDLPAFQNLPSFRKASDSSSSPKLWTCSWNSAVMSQLPPAPAPENHPRKWKTQIRGKVIGQ